MAYPAEMVVKVNEAYHDLEGNDYQFKHPDIFSGEVKRWRIIAQRWMRMQKAIKILDIGCGTGFVAAQIAPFLKETDTIVCSDISATMLRVCKQNTESKGYPCQFTYSKLDGKRIPYAAHAFDFIVLNSVLHHIPDTSAFLKEVQRTLKKEGYLILNHEPNRRFFSHWFLWNNYKIMARACHPIKTLQRLLQRIIRKQSIISDRLTDRVNKRLIADGTITRPLSAAQIQEIVDIHSPTAGKYDARKGIEVQEVLQCLHGFELEYLETYNHLCAASSHNSLMRFYSKVLRIYFPKNGANFLAVFRKKNSKPFKPAL